MNPRDSAFEMQMCECRLRPLLQKDWCVCVRLSVGVFEGRREKCVRWLFSCGRDFAAVAYMELAGAIN